MGWEEGARVMALSNIATAERSGKHLTLHAKDVHSLILVFADDRSTLSFPAPTLSHGVDQSRQQQQTAHAFNLRTQARRPSINSCSESPKPSHCLPSLITKPLGYPYSLPTGTLHGVAHFS